MLTTSHSPRQSAVLSGARQVYNKHQRSAICAPERTMSRRGNVKELTRFPAESRERQGHIRRPRAIAARESRRETRPILG
jgi:hypothetical protein